MSFQLRLVRAAGFALIAMSALTAAPANAQTIISNETLVTTTLVTDQTTVTAKCTTSNCRGSAPLLTSVPVTCPAAIGQTCTFHIALDAKVAIYEDCPGCSQAFADSSDSYQFLVDGAVPTPGPVNSVGEYIFAQYTPTYQGYPVQQPYPASVVATVTNSTSQNHTITVNLHCLGLYGSCKVEAHWKTMRVDVFEP